MSARSTTARTIRRAALVTGTLVLAAGCSSNHTLSGPGASSSTSTGDTAASTTSVGAATTTTLPSVITLPPATTPASTSPATVTTPATTSPATAPPATAGSTTPTAPPPPGTTALGAPTNLHHTNGSHVVLPAAYTCDGGAPAIPGYVMESCQQMPSFDDGVTALVLHRSDDGRFAVAVLFKSGSHLVDRYMAVEPAPATWASVKVQLGDFHFDDGAEVWVGYRSQGSGAYFDLDVLDPRPGGVFFLGGLQGVSHGIVDLHPGGATVQTAIYAGSEPNCCPGHLLQQQITFAAGTWRINAGTTYSAGAAPPISDDF